MQDGRTSPMFLQILVAIASDAIEAGCMPPIALAAASDTIHPVAIKIRIHQSEPPCSRQCLASKKFMMKPLWGSGSHF